MKVVNPITEEQLKVQRLAKKIAAIQSKMDKRPNVIKRAWYGFLVGGYNYDWKKLNNLNK